MDLIKIGKYIAGKRKSLGMTQKQLAEKLGMSDKSVSKWERGICLPDVSVYLELCGILGISLNEFLAGEDIEIDNIEKKSEDTLIQITKDSGRKQRYLKKIIIVLLVAIGIFMIAFGSIVCNQLRQPHNYIEAVDSDSIEMKTAELLSGMDGTKMFRYNSKDIFQELSIYLSEYQSGTRVLHKKVLEISYEDVKSASDGLIVIIPDFDNFTIKLIVADEYSKYMTESPILGGVANRAYYGRSATSIENKCKIEYGTEQGLAALIYGEKGLSSLPIQDITGEYIDTDNEYMYYYSVEFIK
ncbi:XRE family transcriptional regulator [Clostridiaceae bacterium OM08-6BH]|nr:XRE family transcriptional regulator [Clostridiaceae bacterium OM08-6BH]